MRRLTAFDWFMLCNFLVWSAVILFGYQWRRLEFYIYVLLVLLQLLGMSLVWLVLRRYRIPAWVLGFVEGAILLHLAGGTIFVNGTRLYDLVLLPGATGPPWFSQIFRYDKLVHAYFAAVGVAGFRAMWPQLGMGDGRRPLSSLVIVLMVMGLCALVEITEYMGTKQIALPEVGGYDNNLQDLLANFVGAAAAAVTPAMGRIPGRAAKVGAALLGAALAVPVLMPAAVAAVMAYPPYRPLTESPADYGLPYEAVRFPSSPDGVMLEGWYIPGPDGSARAVVLAHGFLNDRLIHGRGLPIARALHDHGFSVVMFDLRGQGRSPGGPVTYGAREQWDVAGAVCFARRQGARQVAVVGYSVGAVAAILAAAADPGIAAVVADSAYADLHEYLIGEVRARSHLGTRYAEYAVGIFRWITGIDDRTVSARDAVAQIAPRPVLLIQGGRDRVVPPANGPELLQATASPRAELWAVPAGRHTHSYEADRELYIDRITEFLQQM
ncbi:MAG TPA: alpha/beta hydrolase [Symbiobacteriaceae bacterium]|nr:alpha/beta hydrolase [Symbiobacteriaceae bacterium]